MKYTSYSVRVRKRLPMKAFFLCICCTLALLLASIPHALAQSTSTNSARATVTYPNASLSLNAPPDGNFPLASIAPGQNVSIQVWLPPTFASAAVSALDGGKVITSADKLIPDATGRIVFSFVAPTVNGTSRVTLQAGSNAAVTLNFWVADAANQNSIALQPQATK